MYVISINNFLEKGYFYNIYNLYKSVKYKFENLNYEHSKRAIIKLLRNYLI